MQNTYLTFIGLFLLSVVWFIYEMTRKSLKEKEKLIVFADKKIVELLAAESLALSNHEKSLEKWEKERQNMLNQIGSQNQSIIKLEATVKSLRNSLDAKGRRHSRHPNNNHKTKASV